MRFDAGNLVVRQKFLTVIVASPSSKVMAIFNTRFQIMKIVKRMTKIAKAIETVFAVATLFSNDCNIFLDRATTKNTGGRIH